MGKAVIGKELSILKKLKNKLISDATLWNKRLGHQNGD